jgi:hypothetical protein
MNEDITPVELSNGARIVIQTSAPVSSTSRVSVQLRLKDGAVDEVLLPYPRAGLGGGRIIVSPSERFALFAMFSGQSEEAYELFGIGRGITRVAGLSYQFGEGASYCFSPDEKFLAMALPFMCSEWWLPWDDEEAEPDGEGRLSFGFGQLRLHEIATGEISSHELRVSASEGWQPARTEYDPDLKPRFLSGPQLALSMPWGEVAVPVPIPDIVVMPVGDEGGNS